MVAAKNVPYKVEPRYKPIYAVCNFVDGQKFRVDDRPQQSFCRWMHAHVYLVGKMDPVLLREWLGTRTVRLEIHDCDEFVAPEDEADAKFTFGCASFSLSDFLKPKTRSLKIRSDVFPLKREQADLTKNLDLNTTARKGERQVEKGSPYLVNNTYAVLAADLAFPIEKFNEAAELDKV